MIQCIKSFQGKTLCWKSGKARPLKLIDIVIRRLYFFMITIVWRGWIEEITWWLEKESHLHVNSPYRTSCSIRLYIYIYIGGACMCDAYKNSNIYVGFNIWLLGEIVWQSTFHFLSPPLLFISHDLIHRNHFNSKFLPCVTLGFILVEL